MCCCCCLLCCGNKEKETKCDASFSGSFDCEVMECEKTCIQGPGGPVCTCPKGQTLLPDGRMCTHQHPCDQWGTCSQQCVPTRHTYKCTCVDGYQIEPDHFTCKSTGGSLLTVLHFTTTDLWMEISHFFSFYSQFLSFFTAQNKTRASLPSSPNCLQSPPSPPSSSATATSCSASASTATSARG